MNVIRLGALLVVASASPSAAFSTEAEAVIAAGTPARVLDDPGACSQPTVAPPCIGQAVTLSTAAPSTYFWWNIPASSLPAGNYTVYVRARSGRADGGAANLGIHVVPSGGSDDVMNIAIRDTRFRWYLAQTFHAAGGTAFHVADFSDPLLVIDKVAIEPALATSTYAISTGTIVSDVNALAAQFAVTRSAPGRYAQWVIAPTALDPSTLYTIRIRARSGGGTLRWRQKVSIDNSPGFGLVDTRAYADINSTSYSWYDLGSFVTGVLRQNMDVSDNSEAGIFVDQISISRALPSDAYAIGVFAGQPIDAKPARVTSDAEYLNDLFWILLGRAWSSNDPAFGLEFADRFQGRPVVFDRVWNMPLAIHGQQTLVQRMHYQVLGSPVPAPLRDSEATQIASAPNVELETYNHYLKYVELRDGWPKVQSPDGQFVEDAYRLLWNRTASDWEVDNALPSLPCWGRALYYSFFKPSSYFGAPASKAEFATRLFAVLLRRSGTVDEISAMVSTLGNTPGSWVAAYTLMVQSREYIEANTSRFVYQYGEPLSPGKPTLRDLVEGRARIQTFGDPSSLFEANLVRFVDGAESGVNYPTSQQGRYTSFTVLRSEQNSRYYAVARSSLKYDAGSGVATDDIVTISLLESPNGIDFTTKDSMGAFRDIYPTPGMSLAEPTLYDPQVVVDQAFFPWRYNLFMECARLPGVGDLGASACASSSFRLNSHKSWSPPNHLVSLEAGISASTPRTLVDGTTYATAWANVAPLSTASGGNCFMSGYAETRAASFFPALSNFLGPLAATTTCGQGSAIYGNGMTALQGGLLFDAHRAPFLPQWDDNNRNVLDWRREGDLFFATYLGANYFWSYGPPPDPSTKLPRPECLPRENWTPNAWHAATSVSNTPVGPYRSVATPYLSPTRADFAELQYPSFAVVAGELNLYFHQTIDPKYQYRIIKAKVVWAGPY